MNKKFRLLFLSLFLSFSYSTFATHIVGGTLTYIYNGGSSYTITLKLYRDCGPNTAQFPNSVTISVLGNNGATFSPSLDITMNLGPITPVPSNLDTCAAPPNPMPCTQEGIYTTTVNNLPPNPGGYHLYYQLIARNLSLTNVNAVCNCVGESYYAYIPGPAVAWDEDFPFANGTTVDNGTTSWSIAAGTPTPNSASVNNNLFQTTGANNGQLTWTSQVIPISSFAAGVNLQVDLAETGSLDPNDSILVYYRLNGGPLTLFSVNGVKADDFTNAVASQTSIVGNSIQIIIKVHYDANSANSQVYKFDNVIVSANNFVSNSNPTFNLFPPLFLCVGQPFTFDHAATDANGDSLYYSFYTPYNGDNGIGTLDPTFPNNTATFTPIIFQPGFTFTNPLGSGPFNLNPNTGLLTGTPPNLGQYVVGVVVKEYRNGVYLSSTLRDFQFNVINCPQFSPAILSPTISCNGNSVTFSNLGGSSGSNWLWNFGDLTTTSDVSNLVHPTYSYPAPGTYTVSLTTGVGTTCANTATAPFTIGFVNSSFTTNAPKCTGIPVLFTNTSTVSANASIVSYTWNFGDGGSSTIQNPSHPYTNAGTYTVSLTTSNSIGCSNTFTTTVTINPATIANANVNQVVCGNNPNIALNGIVTNATGGIWTTTGSGTFSPNTTTLNGTYNPSNSDILGGSVNLVLTTTGNGVCGLARDTLHVTINSSPTNSNAGNDQLICGSTTATLAANTPIVGTGLWTVVSGTATITNPTSPATTVTGLFPGASYTFQWTISSPLCLPSSDVVIVNVDLLPTTSNAGPDQTLCSATSTILTANNPTVGTGLWSVISGAAIITTPTSPTTTVTGLSTSSSVVLRWTVTQGVCSSFDEVTLTNNLIATVNAGVDQVLCIPANISLNGLVSGGTTTGTWSTLGTGTFSPSASLLTATYVLSNADISSGQVTLLLTSTNNSFSCPSVVDTLHVFYTGFNGIVSSTIHNVSCFGATDGSTTINVSGGVSPFTYFWNTVPTQTTQTANNLSQGSYSVIISDGHGCTTNLPVVITQPQPLAVSSVISNVSCSGGSNGSIVLTPTGGTAPYFYTWQPSNQTTASISNKPIGTYTVTIRDSKACQIVSNFTITQPLPLTATLNVINATCFNSSNGSIAAVVSGGTLPYLYNWHPIAATSPTISAIPAGTYSVTITDFRGCTINRSTAISQPTTLTVTVNVTNETCNYLNNGTAIANVSGGTSAYSYTWQPGNQTTNNVSSLSSGTYTLTVTDAHGCSKFGFASINEPSTLAVNFLNQVNVSCFGESNGSVSSTVNGGTPGYTYQWFPGGTTSISIANIQSSTFTVFVTDANGCQAQNSVSISQPSSPLSSTNVFSSPATCFGTFDGTVSSSPIGGTSPYSFHWLPGNSNLQTVSNLAAGTYTVIVNDANNCSSSNSVSVSQPDEINIVTSSINSSCGFPNGTASASVSGGVSPYTYQWSPNGGVDSLATDLLSGSYSVLVIDSTGCGKTQIVNVNDNTGPSLSIASTSNVSCFGGSDGSATGFVTSGTPPFTYNWLPNGGTDISASGLTAGVYTLVVLDSNGCQSLATTTPAISQPTQISSFVSTSDVICYGGSNGTAAIIVTGGTPDYTYQWLPGGNTATSISSLFASTYTVNVRDANNCLHSEMFSIDQPTFISAAIASSTNVSCFGGNDGSAVVNASGGTPFYSYNWSPIGGNSPLAVGLSPGFYTVNISDSHGCYNSASVSILQPAQPLLATGSAFDATCFGASTGAASVNVIGGTPSYTYQWSPIGGNTQNAIGLNAGNYFVLVTDHNNCQTNVALTVAEPMLLSPTLVPINPSCGLNNGIISSQINGGTPPFSYLWLPGNITNEVLSEIGPGTYTLQVIDAQNCTASNVTSVVNIPGPKLAILTQVNVLCYGGTNGSASIFVSQGTPHIEQGIPPYGISWAPFGGNSSFANNLSAGTYTVTAIDSLGCQADTSFSITQPSPITISVASISNPTCFGGINGAISVNATGGSGTYFYNWVPGNPIGQGTSSVSNLGAGAYIVTVTDPNGCNNANSISINQPTVLSSSTSSITNPICFSGTGTASVIGTGGSPPYNYVWATSPIQTGSTATNLSAGITTYTVTDNNGCSFVNSLVISQPNQVLTSTGLNASICAGQQVTLTATAAGGLGNYNYTWQPSGIVNAGTLNVSPSLTTTYSVSAFDQNGCIGSTALITCNVFTLIPSDISVQANTPICPGQNSIVSVQTGGATGGLSYVWNNNLGTSSGPFIVFPTQPTTYIVNVTNSCGANVTDSIRVLFNPPPTINFNSNITSFCIPQNLHFNDQSITGNLNDPIDTWFWNFGDGFSSTEHNPVHSYNQSGTFTVTLTVTTTNGCANSNANSTVPFLIFAYPTPTAAFTINSNSLDLPLDELVCTNQSSNANTSIYSWDFGDGGSSSAVNPHHIYQTVGIFQVQLIASSSNGCADTAFTQIITNSDVIFPNVFTPSSDGSSGGYYNINSLDNDIFFPFTKGVVDYKLQIFNRWGELIFETFDIKQGWDGYYRGKLCQSDVYIWKVDMKLNNGKTFIKSGDVTLLR